MGLEVKASVFVSKCQGVMSVVKQSCSDVESVDSLENRWLRNEASPRIRRVKNSFSPVKSRKCLLQVLRGPCRIVITRLSRSFGSVLTYLKNGRAVVLVKATNDK